MPRADPERSDYCASRHLLRNLDDPVELRRNPLVRDLFADGAQRRDTASTEAVLGRIRGRVLAGLAASTERIDGTLNRIERARMHAALLRCEIERRPLPDVAAELALSDRQLRRARRAAHDAFVAAFRRGDDMPAEPARVCDTVTIRLATAAELHELGQSALALTSCERIAAGSPRPERRIEAACLAAQIETDAGRFSAAGRHVADAGAVFALCAADLDGAARDHAEELIDLAAWSLRWRSGISGGLATPPPRAVTSHTPLAQRSEPRRALLVRALAAYAWQRWEVGDAARGRAAVGRAEELLPAIDASRTTERLAVMYARALLVSLLSEHDDDATFMRIERSAERRGHVRTMFAARAERIGGDVERVRRNESVLDRILRPVDPSVRRSMPGAVAVAAVIAAQCDGDDERGLSAAHLAERLVPARSTTALLARSMRIARTLRRRDYDAAWTQAQQLRADAEAVGNVRVRGSAARYLAAIAHTRRRPHEAQKYIREALPMLEHYGTFASRAHARDLAARIGVA